MCYVPDNLDRWERHDAEQERELEKLPECDSCGKHIQDEYCYVIDDETYCEKCMKECFRVDVMDLIDY